MHTSNNICPRSLHANLTKPCAFSYGHEASRTKSLHYSKYSVQFLFNGHSRPNNIFPSSRHQIRKPKQMKKLNVVVPHSIIDLVAENGEKALRLVSPTIDPDRRLPRKYTQEGQGANKNISPPLEWYNVPEGTKSLAPVVEDIDAADPAGPPVPWVHWVVTNIPATLKGLPEGFSGKEEEVGGEYGGIKEGYNDYKVRGWRGPKLPNHGHRFEFRLFALDEDVHVGRKVTKERLMEAIEGHVLGEAVLRAMF